MAVDVALLRELRDENQLFGRAAGHHYGNRLPKSELAMIAVCISITYGLGQVINGGICYLSAYRYPIATSGSCANDGGALGGDRNAGPALLFARGTAVA